MVQQAGGLLAASTRRLTLDALNHFERLVAPVKTYFLITRHIDHYKARPADDPGRLKGTKVSPATINKELRHIRALLAVGKDWGYLPAVPRFPMVREPGKLPRYVTADDFAAIYGACDAARKPRGLANATAADWWRALLLVGYMTGWRIGDMLGMRREDLDLDAGTVINRWDDAKGKRDTLVKLHPVVVEHLRKLPGFGSHVFAWDNCKQTLYDEFARIQEAAGIHLMCREKHDHGPRCHLYGVHDLRRGFASYNADKLTPDALEALMRHKGYETTQRYISLSRQLDAAVESLHVPEVLRKHGAAG